MMTPACLASSRDKEPLSRASQNGNGDSRRGREELWDVGARRPAVHVETFLRRKQTRQFLHGQPFDQNSSLSSHFTVSN